MFLPQKAQLPWCKSSELLGGTWSDGLTSQGAVRSGKVSALHCLMRLSVKSLLKKANRI